MRWLEHRVPPPLVATLIAAALWGGARWLAGAPIPLPTSGPRPLLAALLVALGLGVDAAALLAFRRARTTVNPLHPERASAVVTAGIYRVTRNPMYLGMALLLVAWGTWLGTPLTLAAVPAFVAYITRFQILPEERALRAHFGPPYEAYCRTVRRWL
jgi:protein-S-isoprenylcysteine O-methyltransferase Ste14